MFPAPLGVQSRKHEPISKADYLSFVDALANDVLSGAEAQVVDSSQVASNVQDAVHNAQSAVAELLSASGLIGHIIGVVLLPDVAELAAEAGQAVAGFVLLVPHYLADTEYPAAAIAGLDTLSVATGLVFDADEIRDENRDYLAKVDDQVEGNPELTTMLHSLEERYDSYMAGSTLAQPIIHTGDLPSADELAAELERFLADRREGDDKRGRR